MKTDKKQVEPQNWMSTASTVLTVLGPVLNILAARLGERIESGGQRKKVKVEVPASEVVAVEPDKVVVTKPSLSGVLLELKDKPYSQELLQRGENLVEELEALADRGAKLSATLVSRGSDVTHDLAERGGKVSQELVKRSEEARKELSKRGKKLNKELNKRSRKVAKELAKRSEKVSKELAKRSEKVSKELSKRSQQLSERDGTFWTLFGFSVGLSAAAVIAFVLIRQRVKQQQLLEEEQSFQPAQNGYWNSTSMSNQGATRVANQPEQTALSEDSVVAIAEAVLEQSAPADAAFVGVVSTQSYYPVATPLSQLTSPEDGKVDVIYFTSEDEAKAQGYKPGI